MRAHALFPQLPHGLLPVSIQAGGELLQLTVGKHLDILSQLVQSELGWRFAGRLVKAMHQLLDTLAAARHKTLSCACQLCQSLRLFHRESAGLLPEAPTQHPELFGSCEKWRSLFVCPTRRDRPAVGEPRLFAR